MKFIKEFYNHRNNSIYKRHSVCRNGVDLFFCFGLLFNLFVKLFLYRNFVKLLLKDTLPLNFFLQYLHENSAVKLLL